MSRSINHSLPYGSRNTASKTRRRMSGKLHVHESFKFNPTYFKENDPDFSSSRQVNEYDKYGLCHHRLVHDKKIQKSYVLQKNVGIDVSYQVFVKLSKNMKSLDDLKCMMKGFGYDKNFVKGYKNSASKFSYTCKNIADSAFDPSEGSLYLCELGVHHYTSKETINLMLTFAETDCSKIRRYSPLPQDDIHQRTYVLDVHIYPKFDLYREDVEMSKMISKETENFLEEIGKYNFINYMIGFCNGGLKTRSNGCTRYDLENDKNPSIEKCVKNGLFKRYEKNKKNH